MEILLTAFLIGLVGSFHCIGMCGPIAFIVPVRSNGAFQRSLSSFIYNSGRIMTYMILGLLFGAIGKGIMSTAITQQGVSIVLGILLIASILIPRSYLNTFNPAGKIGLIITKVKNSLGSLLKKPTNSNLIFIGLLNGLLPCGLVYAALAGSIATGDMMQGALFMMAFGFGTLPMMFTAVLVSNVISVKVRNRIKRLVPVFVFTLGCLFILRGSNLGIPYISPQYDAQESTISCCAEDVE